MLYFKSEMHEQGMEQLIQAFGADEVADRHIVSISYLIAAVGKEKSLLPYIDEVGIDMEGFEQKLLVFSGSEQQMIRFGLQLYNHELDDITFPEVVEGLDQENQAALLSVIEYYITYL